MAAKHRNSSLLQILPDHASDLLGADTSARGYLLTQVNLDTTKVSDANVNFGISVFVLKHDVRAKSSDLYDLWTHLHPATQHRLRFRSSHLQNSIGYSQLVPLESEEETIIEEVQS
jgi:hypothetical protein